MKGFLRNIFTHYVRLSNLVFLHIFQSFLHGSVLELFVEEKFENHDWTISITCIHWFYSADKLLLTKHLRPHLCSLEGDTFHLPSCHSSLLFTFFFVGGGGDSGTELTGLKPSSWLWSWTGIAASFNKLTSMWKCVLSKLLINTYSRVCWLAQYLTFIWKTVLISVSCSCHLSSSSLL